MSRQLREEIVSGKLTLGTELPSEKELARDLGVGRSTVREALRILQAQGLLSGGDTVSTHRPRVSAEQTLSMAASTLENVLRLGQVPLQDLVELRVLIEGAAVERAAAAADPSGLAEARAALELMKTPRIDVDAYRAADLQFHRGLSAAAGNVAFALVMGVLRGAISGYLGEALKRVSNPRQAMNRLTLEHEAILLAIEGGQGEHGMELITDHIRGFYPPAERA